ncbi:MAG TPA: phytanoyl-CoA dioxygenase family protein [Phycisphaerales bacterium]|nr:phytanoyl-CoA dioxygenase family protein [Phycisphaerales bacterium]
MTSMMTRVASKKEASLHSSVEADVQQYRDNGFSRFPAFLDLPALVTPLQTQIRQVIDLVRRRSGLGTSTGDVFDAGLPELLEKDRKAVSAVYDAVRKVPAFFALATHPSVWNLVKRLMNTELPGLYAQGSGIRMDHPDEDQYLSPWHQEYPSHLCSLDMLTLWIPLVEVDETVGSVIFAPGSHKEGLLKVHLDDPLNTNHNGAKATAIVDLNKYLAKYPQTSVDTKPGDVVALHGLTLHASRPNRSQRTRWSVQLRYFNFLNQDGIRIGWTGGMLAGVDLRKVHPEAVVERSAR